MPTRLSKPVNVVREKPRANRGTDDDPDSWDSSQTQALSGHTSEVGQGELGGLLLELTGATAKAAVLVAELDEAEYKAVSGRLNTFLNLVGQITSMRPKPSKIVGFKPKRKRK